MIILKIGLKPKKNSCLGINYKSYLKEICTKFLTNEKNSKYIQEQLNIFPLFCSNYEVRDSNIVFKDKINWYISSEFYDSIMLMVQKLFCSNTIKIGTAEFEVNSMETKSSVSQEEISLQRAVLIKASNKNDILGSSLKDSFSIVNPKGINAHSEISEEIFSSKVENFISEEKSIHDFNTARYKNVLNIS